MINKQLEIDLDVEDLHPRFVVVEFDWLLKVEYSEIFLKWKLKDIVEILIAIPEYYGIKRIQLFLELISQDDDEIGIDKYETELIKLGCIDTIESLVNRYSESMQALKLNPNDYVFKGWIDNTSILLEDARLVYEWA
jgi:hypothetical protein